MRGNKRRGRGGGRPLSLKTRGRSPPPQIYIAKDQLTRVAIIIAASLPSSITKSIQYVHVCLEYTVQVRYMVYIDQNYFYDCKEYSGSGDCNALIVIFL